MKILELTFEQLTEEFQKRYGRGKFHASAVYREVFQKGNRDLSCADEFLHSPGLAQAVEKDLEISLSSIIAEKQEGNVIKFITRLSDDTDIESVLVPMASHMTLCISSQAGCRMDCAFCETGQAGFARNLTVEEIVGQVYRAKVLKKLNIRNIVFMGMGEPFDNFDNVIQAVRVMNEDRGMALAHRYITISTAGRVDGIRKLADLGWPNIRLAVSLNAPNDEIRSKIMPINRKFSMNAVKEALMEYPLKKNGVFFIEYVLIKNVNNSREHARELAEFLKPLKTRVNLIPCNPSSSSPFDPPLESDILRFRDWLVQENLFVRLRSGKGQGIMAGCGQLGKKVHE